MKRQEVIKLTPKEARNFFLESEAYCNIDLPDYFDFKKLLNEIDKFKNGFDLKKAKEDETSFVIYNNKDGKYAWRKFQLVHPVIYLQLIDLIIKNWSTIQKHFSNNRIGNIYACPIYKKQKYHKKQKKTQILAYLEEIEKESIKKSLAFKYLSKLDITDCYPSVYTHSIAWALHTKDVAKKNRRNNFTQVGKKAGEPLLGNDIDYILEAMQSGQTNGIPQGSALMDFIAEIILVTIDKQLSEKLKTEHIIEYEIIRYRDDYRIFTKEKSDNEKVIKFLSEILMEFNFKLNTNKTEVGEDIILMSIKKDKLDNIIYHIGTKDVLDVYRLKRLLLDILKISKSHPNSGFILKILQHFNQRKFYNKKQSWYRNETELLITILINIIINNPRCFAVGCVSIFNLLSKLPVSEQKKYADLTYQNLLIINNLGYNEIWLQRCLLKLDKTKNYENRICNVVYSKEKTSIFGNHFINNSNLKAILDKNDFIVKNKLSKIPKIPNENEVHIFDDYINI